MSKLVVVVGGAGFVGTRLCQLLRESSLPFIIVDKRISETFAAESHVADVRDFNRLMEVVPAGSVLINLAAEHRDDVSPTTLYDEVNVQGARNICLVAAAKGIERIVFTSSVACYGNAARGTGEEGAVVPVNDYGRTKALAEDVYRDWQIASAARRTLAIIRPTVIFGEQNRGNVYNLLSHIASGRFVMVGNGKNIKSMAYVGNVAACLAYLLLGHCSNVLVNYVDEPSVDMNTLVSVAREALGKNPAIPLRLPVWLGILLGEIADRLATLSGRKFPISSVRVRKFTSDSHFTSACSRLDFDPPYKIMEALRQTIRHEFLDDEKTGPLFYSE